MCGETRENFQLFWHEVTVVWLMFLFNRTVGYSDRQPHWIQEEYIHAWAHLHFGLAEEKKKQCGEGKGSKYIMALPWCQVESCDLGRGSLACMALHAVYPESCFEYNFGEVYVAGNSPLPV